MIENNAKKAIIYTITQSLNNQGIEITLSETEKYLPPQWYEMAIEDAEFYVFTDYCFTEVKKDIGQSVNINALGCSFKSGGFR